MSFRPTGATLGSVGATRDGELDDEGDDAREGEGEGGGRVLGEGGGSVLGDVGMSGA